MMRISPENPYRNIANRDTETALPQLHHRIATLDRPYQTDRVIHASLQPPPGAEKVASLARGVLVY